jgi:hypothetical protein
MLGAGYLRKSTRLSKHLARLIGGHKNSILINKIRNKKGDITTDPEEIEKNHQILLQKSIINKT